MPVRWARKGSGFTLFFEAFAMMLAKEMPVAAAARILGEHDTRLGRVLRHYVGEARARQDWSEATEVAVDETATRKGKRYATVVVEIDSSDESPPRLLHMSPEVKGENIGSFVAEMEAHGACPEQVRTAAVDMSPAYRKGVAEHLPMAEVCFDRFRVMILAGEALDEVRKQPKREGWEMSGALWSLRGNEENLSRKEPPKTSRALLPVQGNWAQPGIEGMKEPFRHLARTIKAHWEGILGYYPIRVTSASIEAINGVIPTVRRRARGYRNFENFRAIAYWMAGGLDPQLPSTITHIK